MRMPKVVSASGSDRAGSDRLLRLNIEKAKIMASGPITSWQIGEGKVESVTDFIYSVSKITADGDCSCEIQRHLLLGREVKTNLNCVKKQRHLFADKGLSTQSYGFSRSHVWM